ncbi:MAG: UbiA family prenyltransferase [Bacteroidetes bacterium]|nr:UbiA family prenyltransferase [Bacteroidota bacterium]MBS1932136.1 UbiA family prenyltransferase [Bacteroidota bacterium]
MKKVKNYLSLIKFSHTIFAMPFALIGFFLGVNLLNTDTSILPSWHWPELPPQYFDKNRWVPVEKYIHLDPLIIKLILVLLCMVFARSAAMAINRYLDRSFDAKNPRTAIREIPKGIISANSALIFTIISCVLFLVACFFINKLCFYLAPVALFVVLGYSYTKRFTSLCHLILGLGLSLAPIGAYLAVTGKFNLLPILFSIAVIFWVSGFDIIYALQDVEFDQSQKLYSMPVWLGREKALHVSELFHLLSAGAVVYAGYYGHFGWIYWMGVLIFGGMLIYQHSIVKANDLKRVNIAFMTANGIASIVFAIFVITDLFLK